MHLLDTYFGRIPSKPINDFEYWNQAQTHTKTQHPTKLRNEIRPSHFGYPIKLICGGCFEEKWNHPNIFFISIICFLFSIHDCKHVRGLARLRKIANIGRIVIWDVSRDFAHFINVLIDDWLAPYRRVDRVFECTQCT